MPSTDSIMELKLILEGKGKWCVPWSHNTVVIGSFTEFLVSISWIYCYMQLFNCKKNSLDFLGAKEWFNLQAWWKAVNICHVCFMTKSDFLVVPNPLIERPRRDLQSFLNDALRPGEQSSLDCKLWYSSPQKIVFLLYLCGRCYISIVHICHMLERSSVETHS